MYSTYFPIMNADSIIRANKVVKKALEALHPSPNRRYQLWYLFILDAHKCIHIHVTSNTQQKITHSGTQMIKYQSWQGNEMLQFKFQFWTLSFEIKINLLQSTMIQLEPFYSKYSKEPHQKLIFKYSVYFNKKAQNTA